MDLENLAIELIKWASEPSSLNLIGFSLPRRISVTKLPEWAAKNESFREALDIAKQSIAVNRFNAACANEMPAVFFTRTEGLYDPLHRRYIREEKKFDSDLKKEENESSSNQAAELISQAMKLQNTIKS